MPTDIFLDPPFTGATATAFLARTSGLDVTHISAYTDFLNGLDADSLTSKFDALHIYATQDSTTALLNLVSSSFNGTAHGSPVFTADRGFLGVSGSSTVYIDTGFNPTTAGSPKFVLNSAHLSAWNLTAVAADFAQIGSISASTDYNHLVVRAFTDSKAYYRINGGVSAVSVVNASAVGHGIANRSNSTDVQGYYQGASAATSTSYNSTLIPNMNIYTLGDNSDGTARGSPMQLAMISIGSSLSSADATNFYNRLRTYMTAVGVA